VERGLRLLQEAQVPYGVGCVIPLGADPLAVHHHFMGLGSKQVTYLMPHFTHDTIEPSISAMAQRHAQIFSSHFSTIGGSRAPWSSK